MRYILKLAGWYPSRLDPLSGDFVQRHARCISLYEKVIVLFLAKDPSLPRGRTEVRQSDTGNLTEYIVYYSARGIPERIVSLLRYMMLGFRLVRSIKREFGPPAVVHVNIVWKAGLLALFLRKIYGWNYLVTENWTGYTEKNPWSLHSKGFFIKWLYGQVYRKAGLFLPVSEDLGRQVNHWFPGIPYEVVYNVADTRWFYYRHGTDDGKPAVKRCIHVSTMGYQKNIEGIFRVLDALLACRNDVEIILVGEYTAAMRQQFADKKLLDRKVFLAGTLSYTEVAALVRQSHISFLFSRYENQPCVILEALCCGVPVIATSVGGLPEVVDDSNGILVDSEREDQLLRAFHTILDQYHQYDRKRIADAAAGKFSFEAVGRHFADIYRRWSK